MQKKPQRPERGRALLYSRDSGGKHEMTPSKYVEWCNAKQILRGLKFTGTPKEIKRMVQDRKPCTGDLYFDYCVSGDLLSRPALDACRDEIRRDGNISHLLIPRRDRLARPGDALDGVRLEKELRLLGITLVFMHMTLGPLKRGQRQDVGEAVAGYVDYHKSGEFLDDLAEKMVYVHIELTSGGFSSGGRPPFGFDRFLVGNDGAIIRPLEKGEVVRRHGHHVAWLPSSESDIKLLGRILSMLEHMPASQVAKILTAEGIPSPGSELIRSDHGVLHQVSGVWHQTTITGLARNPFITHAMKTYGRRSMGNHRRMTPEGPRALEEEEFVTDTKTKVVTNPINNVVSAAGAAGVKPIISAEAAERLQNTLDQRAGTQRGKPRSRDPSRNPLGSRIYDLNCTWPMYRVPYSKSFRYTCGLYQQSHGQKCSHNHVDGPTATKLALAAVRQRLLAPAVRQQIEAKIRSALNDRRPAKNLDTELSRLRSELKQAESQRTKAIRNLALADTPELFQEIKSVAEEFAARITRLQHEITAISSQASMVETTQDVVEESLRLVDQLPNLANDSEDFGKVAELFRTIDLQMFVRFHAVQKAKRVENKQCGGLITWGDAPAPIEKYTGPTSRHAVQVKVSENEKGPKRNTLSEPESNPDSGRKAESLGNGSRDDRI